MAASRKQSLKSNKFSQNIEKRGKIQVQPKEVEGPAINPYLMAFFFFVLIGSSVFQIIKTAQSGPIF